MVPEASLEQTEFGLVPKGEGWFVVNAKQARWVENDTFGSGTAFEGEPRFAEIGINISVVAPGQPLCLYHREDAQEDFLVLFGECLLLVEGEERPLQAWDFVHCPPWTDHVFVGAGSGPCAILAVGARERDDIVYPVSEFARTYGASVDQETPEPSQAYAPFGKTSGAAYRGQLDRPS